MGHNSTMMINIRTTASYAVLILALLNGCNGNSATQETPTSKDSLELEEGFVSMFQEGTLDGWEGDTTYWTMQGDILVGEIGPNQEPLINNTFLIWEEGEVDDFVLKSDFKISREGNSGINYRSERLQDPPFALKGYQADIDGQHHYTGQNYEERVRTTLAYRGQRTEIGESTADAPGESQNNAWTNLKIVDSVATDEELANSIQANQWNEIKIIAEGNKLSHYINGLLVSEVIDNDTQHRKDKGLIGVQVHVGPPMKVEYRKMQIKVLNQ